MLATLHLLAACAAPQPPFQACQDGDAHACRVVWETLASLDPSDATVAQGIGLAGDQVAALADPALCEKRATPSCTYELDLATKEEDLTGLLRLEHRQDACSSAAETRSSPPSSRTTPCRWSHPRGRWRPSNAPSSPRTAST